MTTVYVVIRGEYEDERIDSVWSTREAAEAQGRRATTASVRGVGSTTVDQAVIEEFELDTPSPDTLSEGSDGA